MTYQIDKRIFWMAAGLGFGVGLMLLAFWSFKLEPQKVQASAPTGYQTEFATSSVITLDGLVANYVLFATSTGCTSRTISTTDGTGKGINIEMGDQALTLNGVTGAFQAGSTTVIYDAGTTNCGLWTGYGQRGVPMTVTVQENRGFK